MSTREIVIATQPVDDAGGFTAYVAEDSWADGSEDNPNLPIGESGGSGFLGWSLHPDDREETQHDAFVVLRSTVRGFAKDGDVYVFTHSPFPAA